MQEAAVQFVEKLRSRVGQSLGHLRLTGRIAVILLTCLVAGGLIFWLCSELVYFFIARSYTRELADAYDLNRGVTRGILWASFAAIVVLAGLTFSFSKQKRRVGYVGLLSLIIGHSLLLGRLDANFGKNGTAEKCYVMTRTTIKTLNRIGIDPDTGLECRPLAPQIVEKLEEYRSGHRPAQITSNDPKFFDLVTGEPVIWYSKSDQGQIELFDLMGFHPKTGEELTPITRQVAEDWKTQSEKVVRRAAGRVADPDSFGFFDLVSGAAKVWYWRSEAGDYEFYDGPGYHARAGDQFKVITREVIADWRQWLEVVAAKKRAEQEQKERAARERAEREAQQAREAAERDRLSREAAVTEARERAERQAQQVREAAERDRLSKEATAAALQKQLQTANECDRLAANPTDTRKQAKEFRSIY
jgi:signal transduction histidine kinase